MRVAVGPIRLDADVYEEIKRIAEAEERSAAGQIRIWIEAGIKAWHEQKGEVQDGASHAQGH